jgi:hypothetical protein
MVGEAFFDRQFCRLCRSQPKRAMPVIAHHRTSEEHLRNQLTQNNIFRDYERGRGKDAFWRDGGFLPNRL